MITLDFETKSKANLKKVGAWPYSLHPSTSIICGAYGIEDNPIQTWWPGKKLKGVQEWKGYRKTSGMQKNMPHDLAMALGGGMPIEAHNAAFERGIIENICRPLFGWGEFKPTQWRDTQAVAAYYSLPPALDKLLKALGLLGKDPNGERLITKYSKLYLPTSKSHIPDHEWVDWRDMTKTERDRNSTAKAEGGYFNEDFTHFVDYCVDDVGAEQEVSDLLGPLPEEELRVFHLEQEINHRGIPLDEVSIRDASVIVELRGVELAEEFKNYTGLSPTQTVKVKEWFWENGLEIENLQADYLERVLKGDETNCFPTERDWFPPEIKLPLREIKDDDIPF